MDRKRVLFVALPVLAVLAIIAVVVAAPFSSWWVVPFCPRRQPSFFRSYS